MSLKYSLLAVVACAIAAPVAFAQDPSDPNAWRLGVRVTVLGGGDRGHVINQVFDGSPAQQMGLEPGDVLLTLNGQLVGSPADVRNTIFASDSIVLVLKRGTTYFQKDVQFAAQAPPSDPGMPGGGTSGSSGGIGSDPGGGTYKTVAVKGKTVKSVQTRRISPPPVVVRPARPSTPVRPSFPPRGRP